MLSRLRLPSNSFRPFGVSLCQRSLVTSKIHNEVNSSSDNLSNNSDGSDSDTVITGPMKSIRDILMKSVEAGKSAPTLTPDVIRRSKKIFSIGDTYTPIDLNNSEHEARMQRRPRRRPPPTEDLFNKIGLNPLHEFKNVALLSRFTSDMGKILTRERTGLTAKNQRKLAKAIKRARNAGLMPFTHRYGLNTEIYDFRSRSRI